jgi:DNA-binding Xre family transcriptional regulator
VGKEHDTKKARETIEAREARARMGAFLTQRIANLYPSLSKSEAQVRVGREAGGISLSSMQRLCAGKVDAKLHTLANLAGALKCSPADFFIAPATRADGRRRPQRAVAPRASN